MSAFSMTRRQPLFPCTRMVLGVGAPSVRIWVNQMPVDMPNQCGELAGFIARELSADI